MFLLKNQAYHKLGSLARGFFLMTKMPVSILVIHCFPIQGNSQCHRVWLWKYLYVFENKKNIPNKGSYTKMLVKLRGWLVLPKHAYCWYTSNTAKLNNLIVAHQQNDWGNNVPLKPKFSRNGPNQSGNKLKWKNLNWLNSQVVQIASLVKSERHYSRRIVFSAVF